EDEVASVPSRTARVMTTLMRNGRDRRSGEPVKCHARKERVLLFGTRSADYIRASSHNGCIQRPNTWLHPNASLKCQIFSLHRRRRPYMRRILVVGACAVLKQARRQPVKYPWLTQLLARRPFKVVAVALANKMARIAWALLAKGGTYRTPQLTAV